VKTPLDSKPEERPYSLDQPPNENMLKSPENIQKSSKRIRKSLIVLIPCTMDLPKQPTAPKKSNMGQSS